MAWAELILRWLEDRHDEQQDGQRCTVLPDEPYPVGRTFYQDLERARVAGRSRDWPLFDLATRGDETP